MPSIAALRHAPWSLSKVKCALRCAQEFHFKYVLGIAEPEVAPDARLGKAVHGALEAVLLGQALAEALAAGRKELLHDEERTRYDQLAAGVEAFAARIGGFRTRRRVRSEWVEHKLAVRADLSPTMFIARDAFFRGVWDVGYLYDDGVLAVVDHKTGMRRPAADFTDQLEGYATLAAAHVSHVRKVWLGVHFVADAAMEWTAPVALGEVRTEFAPRLLGQIEQAALAVDAGPSPRTSGWCVRCSYRSICPAMRTAAAPAS